MVISIHQPDYIPYLGYFYKIAQSDIFVFLDDCQFSNDNMHNWNIIKTPQGECRLKVPVEYHFGDMIDKVRTKDELKWKQKHLKTIEMNYCKTPFFQEIYPDYQCLLEQDYNNLAEQNIAINSWICKKLGINTKVVRSSELNINSVREERVIDIVKQLGGDIYLSGNGAKAYQRKESFSSQGIVLKYTDYKPINYPQLWGGFVENLSIIDIFFNCGFDWNYIQRCIKEAVELI